MTDSIKSPTIAMNINPPLPKIKHASSTPNLTHQEFTGYVDSGKVSNLEMRQSVKSSVDNFDI